MTDQKQIIGAGGGGGGKGGGGGGRTPKTDPDSLDSRSRASVLDLIGEGELAGLVEPGFSDNPIAGAANSWHQSIFLNNTPLQNRDGSYNFNDVKIHARSGRPDQTVMPGFEETSSETALQTTILDDNPVEFTISNTSIDAVRIVIGCSVLQKIKKNGDTTGATVELKFQKQQDAGAWVDLDLGTDNPNGSHIDSISGRTADLYQRQYKFDIQGNDFPVKFRAVRITQDDGDVDLNAEDLISIQTAIRLDSYALITYSGPPVNGTYTQSNEAGNADGNVVTVSYSAGHGLVVGNAVNLNFTSGTSVDSNFTITSVPDAATFKVTTGDSRTTSGNVTFSHKYTYPNSALVGLRLEAEQFNSIPSRAYKVRGLKIKIPGAGANGSGTPTVVSSLAVAQSLGIPNATEIENWGFVYYPTGYIFNGTMGAAQWCADPAWCLYDLLLSSRYGTGDHISADQLDIYSFYAASRYASEIVSFKNRLSNGSVTTRREPRFLLNAVIRKREDTYKVINSLCSVFRAMPYYSNGSLTLTQDKKDVDPSHIFTLANVTPEGFNYSGTAQKTRTTVAIVKYFDNILRDAAYEEVIDEVGVQKFGVIQKAIDAFGCTSRSTARRLGKWLLYVAQHETETCTFVTSLEAGTICRPGQVIEIADPVKAGVRRGGKIKAVTGTNKITVDNTDLTDLPPYSGNYGRTIHVVMGNGTVCSVPILGAITSEGVVTVDGNFRIKVDDSSGRSPGDPDYVDTYSNQAPNVGSLWIIETHGSSNSAENIETSTWKVISVEEQEDFKYGITCVSHNESKYDHIEVEEELDFRDVTNLNELPASPSRWAQRTETDSSVTTFPIQQLYRYRDEIRVKVIAAWKPVLGVNEYQLKWRIDNGGWNIVRQQNPDYEILDVAVDSTTSPRVFDFQVYSVNSAGRTSVTPLATTFNCTGKSALPSNVATFTVDIDPHLGVQLKWVKIVPVAPEFADLDIRGYEIRRGTSWSSATLIGEFNTTSTVVGTITAGATTTYLIKAVDTDGNYSAAATSTLVTITPPGAPVAVGAGFAYEDDNLILNWTAPTTGSYAIDQYEIYQGSISSSNLKGTVSGTTFSLPVTWNSEQTFKIRAKDIAGNNGSVLTLTVTFTAAAAPNIQWHYEGRTLRLNWNAVSGSTSTKQYEIRQSATGETVVTNADLKNTIQANDYVLDVDWNSSVRFWVRAIDVNGNFGTAGRTGVENYPDVVFSAPASPVVTHNSFDGKNENIVLNWNSISAPTDDTGKTIGLPVSEYKIYRTVSSATSISNSDLIAKTYATFFSEKVTWNTGSQKYWVSTVDVNGNEGTADAESITILQIPAPANITQEVVDNNVLLRWEEPSLTGCLPVSFYNLYRTTSEASNLIGSKQGKFTTVFEQAGGTYKYFLAAVDSSGRQGVTAFTEAKVDEPPDYVLNADLKSALIDDAKYESDGYVAATYSQSNSDNSGAGLIITVAKSEHGLSINQQIEVDFTSGSATEDGKYIIKSTTSNNFTFEVAGSRQTTGNIKYKSPATLTNVYGFDNAYYFCLDTSTQYQNHFAGTGFDSNGANVPYALPSENSGVYEEIFDYGGVLATSSIAIKMSFDPDSTVGQGLTITPRIYIRETDSSAWIDKGAGNGTVLGNDFRYVKARFDLTGADNNDLIKVTEISTKLSVKQKTDQGSVTIASGQAQSIYDAGVQVSFTPDKFIDIDSISLTLRGSTGDARYAIYDFVDAFAPNGFKVYLYKADGTKTHGTFDWTARGV